MIPTWLDIVASVITFYWTLAVVAVELSYLLDRQPYIIAAFRWIASEVRPLYLPAALVQIAHDIASGQVWGWGGLADAFLILNWLMFRNEGDDRWKRRRKKAVEKVKALASGRLVAVPAGAS